MSKSGRKRPLAVTGESWTPVSLDFLRSAAFASLSPHGVKLLMDMHAALGPNATGNGNISIAHKLMKPRGWSGRTTLLAAAKELESAGLIRQTRTGTRTDCILWAITLYPLDCDVKRLRLDAGAGSFSASDWRVKAPDRVKPPTADQPVSWVRPRKRQS